MVAPICEWGKPFLQLQSILAFQRKFHLIRMLFGLSLLKIKIQNLLIFEINICKGTDRISVKDSTMVHKVIFDGKKAIGVEIERKGVIEKIYSNEVILR